MELQKKKKKGMELRAMNCPCRTAFNVFHAFLLCFRFHSVPGFPSSFLVDSLAHLSFGRELIKLHEFVHLIEIFLPSTLFLHSLHHPFSDMNLGRGDIDVTFRARR